MNMNRDLLTNLIIGITSYTAGIISKIVTDIIAEKIAEKKSEAAKINEEQKIATEETPKDDTGDTEEPKD